MKFVKIDNVESVENTGKVYDIELDKNHYFAANGIISHNCRLRNELQENTFSYSLGAGGTQSGSLNVITINMNRLVQNFYAEEKTMKLEDYLRDQVQKVHKYQLATKEFFKGFMEANMLDSYREGFIDMNKQFLTIGINGLLESAEYLGLEANNNDRYKEYISKILKVIYHENKADRQRYKDTYWYYLKDSENNYKLFSKKVLKVFDKTKKEFVQLSVEEVFKNIDNYSIEEEELKNASGRVD